MRIDKLILRDWRNVHSATLKTNRQFVVLHGENGAGKTNILEAVYVFCALKSFRDNSPQSLITKGKSASLIDAVVQTPFGERNMSWRYNARGRGLLMDDAKVNSLSSWFSAIRTVLFCPDQKEIVKGGPENRRKFIDRACFTARPAYIQLARDYGKALSHKRALLKLDRIDLDVFDAYNSQLLHLGVEITKQRQMMLSELSDPFVEMVKIISSAEDISLSFSGIAALKSDEIREFFRLQLAKVREDEIRMKKCLSGPHRDDIKISINGMNARKFASQGQVRSIVLGLKLAELEAARIRGENPLFLLDDLSSELDRNRTRKLVELLSERDNQIWITTTDPKHLGPLPSSTLSMWQIEKGEAVLSR